MLGGVMGDNTTCVSVIVLINYGRPCSDGFVIINVVVVAVVAVL